MDNSSILDNKIIDWLLEKDNPSVRYFTLKKILNRSTEDKDLQQAYLDIMLKGPVPQLLMLQKPGGWWGSPQFATMPMYTSTAWQLMILAELGVNAEDNRIRAAVDFVFSNAQDEKGAFPHEGSRWQKHSPFDLICNDGMIAWGLIGVGTPYSDSRMKLAVDFLADAVNTTDFECRFNKGAPCTWGLVKALRVMAVVPEQQRTSEINKSIDKAVTFILDKDLAKANYPTKPGGKVSEHWFKLGFPRSYHVDVLQTMMILTDLGYTRDKRLKTALDFLISKRKSDGTWLLEEIFNKLLIPFVKKSAKQPSKWITWQIIYIFKNAGIQ